ncbi:glycosyltransferase [Denitromonas ohlonensis]|uniref:Glycosyltransferase n=2 Tax=Denitromonas TaxID=139331 RepID=A0A557QZ49_9RHOO|nr:glycosyltransferase [Denitromonas ohlonensis]TVO58183.1 glycosyltransferase [Denitromonas ohlonensis]TVO70572.1 glycosyltransferase [Denitromonas ohlonensis]
MLKIDLACGNNKRPGFIGIDSVRTESTDIVHDLTKTPWPLDNNSVDEVFSSHFIEHLTGDEFIRFMDELWRILKPGAKATMIAPYYTSMRSAQDPTHKQPICENKFLYFTKAWRQLNRLTHYPIKSDFEFNISYAISDPRWRDAPPEEKAYAQRHLWNVVDDIIVVATKRDTSSLGRTPDAVSQQHNESYTRMLNARDYLDTDYQYLQKLMTGWAHQPSIQLLVQVRESEYAMLANMLDSLAAQPYPAWSLAVLAPTACPDPAIADLPHIDWLNLGTTDITAKQAFDAVVTERGGDIVVNLPPGSEFDPFCLWRIAHEFATRPAIQALYTDDDVIRLDDERVDPRFKPDFQVDFYRSCDYIGPMWMRRDAYLSAGGFSEIGGATHYDLGLRLLDTAGIDAIAHIAEPLLSLPVSPTLLIADADAMSAVKAHLARNGEAGEVMPGSLHATWRIEYQHDTAASVDIVIPFRNSLEYLEPAVDSLLKHTTHSPLKLLLVDNGSDDPDCQTWREKIETKHADRIRFIDADGEWNRARLNNIGAAAGDAECLVFMHHDTQVLDDRWLPRLLSHAQRAGVVAVAPRQITPGERTLDFTGSIVGLNPFIGSPDRGHETLEYPGYLGRQQVDQNYNVLNSACLAVSRKAFKQVGGYDETMGLSTSESDLTLRLSEHGRLVWTPWATIAHYSDDAPPLSGKDLASRQNSDAQRRLALLDEERRFVHRHIARISHETAWNPKLALGSVRPQLDVGCAVAWHHLPINDIPRIIADPVQGAGEYRVLAPLRAARRAGKALSAVFSPPSPDKRRIPSLQDIARLEGAKSYIIHHGFSGQHLVMLQQIRDYLPELLVVGSMDDLSTAIPPESSVFNQWSRDTRSRVRESLALCHRLIVSTEPLAEFARTMVDDIRIVPNRIEWERWKDVHSLRRTSEKPRVGWAGAQQHQGDLALIAEAVRETHEEVDWIFFGLCPDEIRPYVKEDHGWVSFDDYPSKLASLNLDLAVAPLEVNAFNEAKSNLRLLDYGILGWPVICTDVEPYRNAPVTRVNNSTRDWVEAIRAHVGDLEATAKAGDSLHDWVMANYILEEHVDDWLSHHLP